MSRIERAAPLAHQPLNSPQQQKQWQWEAEQAAHWAAYRGLPEDHPQVAADVIAGQADVEGED